MFPFWIDLQFPEQSLAMTYRVIEMPPVLLYCRILDEDALSKTRI